MRIRETGEAEEQANLMPLIDVVFLLLIFFLVATTVAQEELNRDVMLPNSSAAQPVSAPPPQLFINILEDGTITVGSETYTLQTVRTVIDRVARNNPDRDVVIRADAETKHKYPAGVLNMCREAGMNEAKIAYLLEGEQGAVSRGGQ
jgi:biopolymer transport protein ExbD